MKKKLFTLIAVALILSILLQGCLPLLSVVEAYEHLESVQTQRQTDEPASADMPESQPDSMASLPEISEDVDAPLYPLLPSQPVERPYEAWLSPVSFDQLRYLRPDVDSLISHVDQLVTLLDSGADCAAILDAFEKINQLYVGFYTMDTLANICYTRNLNNSYYDSKYNWCEEQAPVVEQALERCFVAMAGSALRSELEVQYFGEGFFLSYDENQLYSDSRVVALMQEEAALQTQYMALQSDMTITWNGEERLVEEVLADPALSYNNYLLALDAYYDKYNPQCAEIFIELIRVRKELAQVLEYDSYADFAYLYYYERDYTPAQAADYIAEIATQLVPVYEGIYWNGDTGDADMDEVMALLEGTCARFGGAVQEAFDFMQTYALYDLSSSSSKMPGSYTTYLDAYEMPYLFVTPTGSMDDFLTLTHEFGHFLDAYVNCNTTTAVDCAEIFSQGLEFLALDVADLNIRQHRRLREAKLYDSLQVFISQACYSEFERRAYALPEAQLTVEGLNALFLECCEQFASAYPGAENYIAPGWVDVQHFFIAPYYMISYCLSNDVALQIYQRQTESGDGLALYMELMH